MSPYFAPACVKILIRLYSVMLEASSSMKLSRYRIIASAPGLFALSFIARSAGSMGCQSSPARRNCGMAQTSAVIAASAKAPAVLVARGGLRIFEDDLAVVIRPRQVEEASQCPISILRERHPVHRQGPFHFHFVAALRRRDVVDDRARVNALRFWCRLHLEARRNVK